MSTDTKANLKRALALLKEGDKQAATPLLAKIIGQEPNNEHAWFLLGVAVEERDKQIYAFEQVLKINPAHEKARQALQKLGVTPPEAPKKPDVIPAKDTIVATPDEPEEKPAKRDRLPIAVIGSVLTVLCLIVVGGILLGGDLLGGDTPAAASQPTRPIFTNTPPATLTPRPTATATALPTATRLPTETPPPTATATALPLSVNVQTEIIAIQAEVAALRGLQIIEPVTDEIMPLLKLQIILTDLFITDEYIATLPDEALVLTTLGFMNPDYDLVQNALDSKADAIGGFYLPDGNHVHVIGTGFYGIEKWIYAHEYVHALSDQHFDLNNLGVYPDCLRPQQTCLAIQALVEGDAEYVQELWLNNNKDQFESHDLLRFTAQPSPLFQNELPPPYFGLRGYFPYEFGYYFVAALFEHGGWEMVNKAYTLLPLTTEQILHPEKYIAYEPEMALNDQALEDVLGGEWRALERDSLGEWDTYLLLAWGAAEYARMPDEPSQVAAAGWGGDTYQVYYNDNLEQSALAAHWVWDTPQDQTEFYNQMRAHLAARYLNAEVAGPGSGVCWLQDLTFSCLYANSTETLWLQVPDLAVLETIKALFPQFP